MKFMLLTFQMLSFPARSCVEVSCLPKDVKIEIEVVAFSAKN